jgi:activating signal cointegrator 1
MPYEPHHLQSHVSGVRAGSGVLAPRNLSPPPRPDFSAPQLIAPHTGLRPLCQAHHTMSTLRSEADVLRFVAGFHRKVLVWGVEDEVAIAAFRAVVEECEKVAEAISAEFSRGRWLVVVDCKVAPSREAPNAASLMVNLVESGVVVLQCRSETKHPPIPGVAAVWETEPQSFLRSPTLLRHVCGVVSLGVTQVARRAAEVGLPLRVVPCEYVGRSVGREDEAWLRGVVSGAAVREVGGAAGGKSPLPRSPLPARGAAEAAKVTLSLKDATRPEAGMVMSMHQPWASLVICGLKRVEGRTWPSDFRGRLWIHAAAHTPTADEVNAVCDQYRALYSSAAGIDIEPYLPRSWPTSCLLGSVDVVAVVPQSHRELPIFQSSLPPSVLGEFESPFCFLCENPRRCALVPTGGSHKIWPLPADLLEVALASSEPVRDIPEPVTFPRIP